MSHLHNEQCVHTNAGQPSWWCRDRAEGALHGPFSAKSSVIHLKNVLFNGAKAAFVPLIAYGHMFWCRGSLYIMSSYLFSVSANYVHWSLCHCPLLSLLGCLIILLHKCFPGTLTIAKLHLALFLLGLSAGRGGVSLCECKKRPKMQLSVSSRDKHKALH